MRYFKAALCCMAMSMPLFTLSAFQWRCNFPREQCFDDCTVGRVERTGLLELRGTNVKQGLSLHGSLDADGAIISSAYIVGRAIFKKSCIEGDVYIIGSGLVFNSLVQGIFQIGGMLEARKSQFNCIIQAASGMIDLQACTAPSIYLFPCHDEMQVVKLTDGTHIEGDIAFEAGNGRVFIDRTSSLKGHVIGGMCIVD